jgi:predicted permease
MTELLLIFVNNLLPIFLASGVGALLSWKAKLDVRQISKVLFYIFSPCLVLKMILNNYSPDMPLGTIALVVVLTQILLTIFIVVVGKLLKYDRSMISAMVLPVMTINAGNMGLPICLFVFGEEGVGYATIFFLVSILGTYTFGVAAASLGKQSLKDSLLGLLKLPMIYSVLIGFVLIWTGWQLPTPIQRTVDILGDAAIPTMLVVLGMQLQKAKLKENVRALALCTGTRLILGPLVVLGLGSLFGMTGLALHSSLVQGGMPGAVTSTVLATEYDTKPEFVTAAVTIATVLSPLTLTPLIALLT